MSRLKNIAGLRFGLWTVICLAGIKEVGKRKAKISQWLCRCDCGTERVIGTCNLRSGHSKSCGCAAVGIGPTKTHGMSSSRIYKIWLSMRKRCYYPAQKYYENYGGRGIKVCDRWLEKGTGFQNFLADMGKPPTEDHEIDRKDNGGDYTPENCQWITRKDNCRNRRSNKMITFMGQTACLAEWAERLGIKQGTLGARLRNGWPLEEALSVPSGDMFPST